MNFPHARLRRALPVPLLRRLRAIHWQLCPPEPELALVSRFADPSRAFLDVGANTGVYLERALGRFAALYAVEPDPELAWYLERAFAGRVTVLALALSSRPGHMPFYLPHHAGQAIKTRGSLEADANPGLDQTVRTVPVATLDGLDLPPLGFVKIDVEGHELAVLEGGRERLRRDRPRLLIEIEERHHPGGSGRVFALLAELGYEAFYLADGRLKSLGGTDLAVLQNIARAKPLTARARPARGYVNNFFFSTPRIPQLGRRSPAPFRRVIRAPGFLPVADDVRRKVSLTMAVGDDAVGRTLRARPGPPTTGCRSNHIPTERLRSYHSRRPSPYPTFSCGNRPPRRGRRRRPAGRRRHVMQPLHLRTRVRRNRRP